MTHDQQLIMWAAASIAPVALTSTTRREADAQGFAALLLATWCIERIASAFLTPPQSMWFYPLEDAACGALAFHLWIRRREPWKLVLAALFLAQIVVATAYWAAWSKAHVIALLPRVLVDNVAADKHALNFYRGANNVLYAIELLTVSWGALAHVVVSAIGGRLPGLARKLHHPRAGP